MKNHLVEIVLFSIFIFISCSKDNVASNQENLLNSGSNQFVFTYSGLPQKPINVFYNIPAGNRTNMPIIIVFHGDERNASEYRDIWVNASNQYGFMVFAPEFNSINFPGGSSYIIGNVYQDGNFPTAQTLNNESVWTFSMIEPLFDFIKVNSGSESNTYYMFGHSGGGQFVHRFVLLKPNAMSENKKINGLIVKKNEKSPEWVLTSVSLEVESFKKWLVKEFKKAYPYLRRRAEFEAGMFLLAYGWKTTWEEKK
jgi:poly(3-hydroxybutyrate) depolymerase